VTPAPKKPGSFYHYIKEGIITMYTNQELIRLWSNDQKRREFINRYKDWGVWFKQPELDLTFYKYDLPDGSGRIIAMEYKREPYSYSGEKANRDGLVTAHKLYFHQSKCFNPSATSDFIIAGHLMELKTKLAKDMKRERVIIRAPALRRCHNAESDDPEDSGADRPPERMAARVL
jgi:hypothetical protein